ncbi:MAG: DUF1508 domain-containing protein [Erysipelotrichaceae bacterium]|nr:DUF1508 domain-containing protein [Erysipelotrichaceae bacterium]
MKNRKKQSILTISCPILTLIVIGIGVLLAYLQKHLSALFSSEVMKSLGNTLSFQEKGTMPLIGAIVFYALMVFGVVSSILAIAKKKGGYILPILAWVAAFMVLLFSSDYITGEHNFKTIDLVFAIVLAVISFIDALLPFFYVSKEEEVQTIASSKSVDVSSKPQEKVENKEEDLVKEKEVETSKEEQEKPIVDEKTEEKQKEQPVPEKTVEQPIQKAPKNTKKKPIQDEEKLTVTDEAEKKEEAKEATALETPAPIAQDAPVKEEGEKETAPVTKDAEIVTTPVTSSETNSRIAGKYEVYPEAGFFKYRLKANNGEILIVSNGYKTRDGAKKGIETLQKNIANGVTKITTDKKGYAQFRIFTGNDSRLIVSGEIYPNAVGAQNALNSVQKFYRTDKVIDLDEIPETEIREWRVTLPDVEVSEKGKFEVFVDPETSKFRGRLLANNGQVLFVTSTYASKNGVISAFEKIQKKLATNDLTVTCDKQGRYQFMIYADNGSVMVMGETYPSRERAISAATSAKRFAAKATILGMK